MKNLLTATLPGLALLALGGCATSGALTSTTESDGVYYSSQDKTTASGGLNQVYDNRGYATAQPQSVQGSANPDGFRYNAPTTASGQPLSTAEDANPDYVAGTGNATEGYSTSTLGASTDYYANQLSNSPSGFGVPYTGPGVSTYNYSPAVSVAPSFYGSPFGYGLGLSIGYGFGGGFGYPYYGGFGSPYGYSAFYDPFYSPFYSGFGYGYGFGYGGFGGFGYPYAAYGFGYPYGGYGGFGYGGYGYGYGAYRTGSLAPGAYATEGGGRFLSGPRVNHGGMLTRATTVNPAQPTGNQALGATGANILSNRRGGNGPVLGAPGGNMPGGTPLNQPIQRGAFGNGGMAVGQPTTGAPGTTQGNNMAQRRGFFGGFFGNGASGGARPNINQGGFSNGQPQGNNMGRRGGFSQGSFGGGQPQMQQRSFSQPSMQPQRSFSQPSMAPQRSFGGGSFGGGGGGGFGGGGFGGGGGGRRGGR